nr:MAG TPA: Proteasome regulatory subunit C-terminal [Caudoviricetes sp.]
MDKVERAKNCPMGRIRFCLQYMTLFVCVRCVSTDN